MKPEDHWDFDYCVCCGGFGCIECCGEENVEPIKEMRLMFCELMKLENIFFLTQLDLKNPVNL